MERSGNRWGMKDSFVKKVTFELRLEGWGKVFFYRQQGLGEGLCRPQERAMAKILRGQDKTWYDLRELRAGQCGWRRALERQEELRLEKKVET